MLWYRYQEVIERFREINPESVDQFRDKVVTRVRELESGLMRSVITMTLVTLMTLRIYLLSTRRPLI